ncbi:Uncharacterized protein FWK35_00021403, partial [Aphis craccivora]
IEENILYFTILFHLWLNISLCVYPIHHEGIHLSISAFRTSPTESILCYAGELPLQLIRDKNTLLHCIKRKTTPNLIGHIALFKNQNSNTNRDVTKKLKTIQVIYSNSCRKNYLSKSITMAMELSTDLLTLSKHEINHKLIISYFYEIIQFHFPNHTQIYTDASKSEHGVGFSVIHNRTSIQHKLPAITNIFTAENYAILEAIKLANS